MNMNEKIAQKAVKKIHWNTGRNPDAYEQEAEHRTFTIIMEAFRELIPAKKPLRIL